LTEAARVSPLAGAFAAIPESVILSWGWRRRVIAALSGAVGAFALPPFNLFFLMAAPMTVAVWLIDGSEIIAGRYGALARLRSAFGAGWWFGLGYFLVGLWWIGTACLVDGTKFLWALPFSVLAIPAVLAVFPAFGFALAAMLWSTGPWRVFALAFGLGSSEWARGLLFTGFPWNDIGMALGANLALAQIASFVGLHGLTLVAAAIFAAPATLWRPGARGVTLTPTVCALVGLLLVAGFGVSRLDQPASPDVPAVRLRLMQPNVSQGESFSPQNKDAIIRHYIELSERNGGFDGGGQGAITHLIWPESAFPFILARDPQALGDIASMLGPATLITGAARADIRMGRDPLYYNAIELVGRDGLRRERYDKHRLVPFGEYLPFASLLEKAGITQFVEIPGGFEPGTGPRILRAPGLPVALPLICYEAIFPFEIGDAFSRAERAAWLLNVTDDAWFGVTPGPYQHYAQARLRAIELGLPLVRVANSGISAVTDGLGREIVATSLGVEDVIDANLPEALAPTWQARFGSLSAALIAAAFAGFAFYGKGSR
jgi:apolipoprotein N-acyltransferase